MAVNIYISASPKNWFWSRGYFRSNPLNWN